MEPNNTMDDLDMEVLRSPIMHRTRIPSKSTYFTHSTDTPRHKTRSTLSVGSPARASTSGRKEANRDSNSFALSPLSDNTEIEQPRQQSWRKKVNHSRNISEFLETVKAMGPNNNMYDLDIVTPRHKTRSTLSVGSPARASTSGRKEANRDSNSFAQSPLRKTVLNDNTEIEQPRQQSWRKKVNHSRNISEFLETVKAMGPNNNMDDLDIQRQKQFSLDLPESSGSKSIASIVIPQKKSFTQKENVPQNLTNAENKTLNVSTKTLFGQGVKRSRPAFPAGLLNLSPVKTLANKTKELATEVKAQPRNLFGNIPATEKRNMFADFIVSESEDEISEIQPELFAFQRNANPVRHSTASHGNQETFTTSSHTTDIEMEDWKMLPSSTMVEHQFDALASSTPGRKTRLSKLSEAKESSAGTNSNNTINKTKLSNKSASKNKSKITPLCYIYNNTSEVENDEEEQNKSEFDVDQEDKIESEIEESDEEGVQGNVENEEEVDQNEEETDNVEMIDESDHEASKRLRQTKLEMHLKKMQKENEERRLRIAAKVKESLKSKPVRTDFLNCAPYNKGIRKTKMKLTQKEPKAKRTRTNVVSLEDCPEEVLNDLKYKPPKRYSPAAWTTKRLYTLLEAKLEPKYDYKARVRAEKLVEMLYKFACEARKQQRVASPHAVAQMKHEMARLGIVKTHFDFYDFIREYLPKEVKVKVVPDIVNEIPLPPNGVFSDIMQ